MIPDSTTNFLYLADTLPIKYANFFQKFEKVLADCNINFKLLPNTKDVWAVDYMPVQIEKNSFVRFVYKPKYLKSKTHLKTISDVDSICEVIGIEPLKSNILLDGGNVIRTTDKVIMTDRIFEENPTIERKLLINELKELLQVDKLLLIPEEPGDWTGHADGMVRFLDNQTVLINDYKKENEEFIRAFEIAIHNTGLNYYKIPLNPSGKDDAIGYYINYLEINDTVIIPTFATEEDDAVVKQFEQLFKGKTIAIADCKDIACDGGLLNCITWNILK
jgi:agmatine deiminase